MMALTKGTTGRRTAASETTTATEAAGSGTSRGSGRAVTDLGATASSPQFGSWSVRADSVTPYTDATNCRHSKRKSPAGTCRGSSAGVRRPMNAFMVWSQLERRRISAADPTLHNAEISRRLGARWRRLSAADRRPYVEEADRLRVLHAVEFPDYKYTPRKSRKTRTPISLRRQSSQRAIANRKSIADDFAQLPADAFDSEVSLYFAGSGSTSTAASCSRRTSKRRAAVSRRTAAEAGDRQSSGRNLPPTPDSSAHSYVDRGPLFRVINGSAAAARPSRRPRKTTSAARFEFPAVASPSDVQLGGLWTDSTAAADDEDSNDVGALDTPISLEQDPLAGGGSLFNASDHRGVADGSCLPFGGLGEPPNDVGGPFFVDYCTPEVAAIVRDDWLEETIHNDALI